MAAAAALVEEQGIAAVGHRAVAARAGVAVAATTYYFATLDDLVEQAVAHLADAWLARSRAAVDALPPRLRDNSAVADAVVAAVLGESPPGHGAAAGVLAMYERYLEAGRHPRLRATVTAYDEQVDALVGEVLARGGRDPADAPLALALVDGSALRALAEGGDPGAAATAALVRLFTRPANPLHL